MRKVSLRVAICLILSVLITVLIGTAWGSETVLKAQERLKQLGYEPGPADGGLGAQTIAALKKFQRDHNLKPSGALDRVTMQALGLTAAPSRPETQPSRPEGQRSESPAQPKLSESEDKLTAAELAQVPHDLTALREFLPGFSVSLSGVLTT